MIISSAKAIKSQPRMTNGIAPIIVSLLPYLLENIPPKEITLEKDSKDDNSNQPGVVTSIPMKNKTATNHEPCCSVK